MDRIKEHPILGASPEGKMVSFTFDGKELEGIEGEPIAAALKAADVMVHRYTKKRAVYHFRLLRSILPSFRNSECMTAYIFHSQQGSRIQCSVSPSFLECVIPATVTGS